MKTNFTNAQKNWLIAALVMYCLLLLPEVKAQTLSLDEINDIVVQAEEGQCGAVVNFDLNAFYAEEAGSGFDLGGTFNGHTYFVTNTSEGKFWPDSEATAQSFGAHLVALNSEEESDFVRTLTTNTFWIGLNDLDNEGTFVWSNGDPVTYTGWAPGEPNNNGGGEDVVEMFPGSGEWNDAKVSGVVVSYIIEFGEITLNSTFASGSIFPVGTTTVTVTASDDSGNSITRNFNITVEDTQAPTVITQNIIRNLDAGNSGRNGQALISPEEIDNGSFDECGIGTMALDQPFFDCSDLGNNVVTLTVTDIHGNTSSATAMVTIQDITPPDILGLNDITVDAASGTCEAVVNYTASVDDNCVAAPWFVPGFTFGGTHNGHTYFVANEANFWPEAEAIAQSYGAHLVAINDEAENEFVRSLTSSTFWIGLNDLENEGTFVWSNGDPFTFDAWGINEPNNNNNEDVVEMSPTNGLWNDAKVSGVVPTYIIEFNSLQMQFEYSTRSGSSFPVGTTEVIFTATDGSGNTSSSSFNVTVQDQEVPTIVTRDISVSLDETGQVTIGPEDVDDGSFDACGVAEMSLNQTSFDCSHLGLNTVTLSVSDSSGNVSTASLAVNVADNTPPSISGAEDITVEAPSGTCEAVVNFTVIAEDNCDLSVPDFKGFEFGGIFNGHSYYVSTVPNFWPQAEAIAQSLGGHLVAINDEAENEFVRSLTSSTFWIGLNDLDDEGNFVWSNGDPLTFSAWGVNEPNNNNNEDVVEMSPANGLWNDAKVSGVVPTYIIEFNSTMIGEYSIASGSIFPVGSTEVTYTVTDQAGNLASTTFNVIVEDVTPPIAIAQDLVVQLDQNGEASITADDVNNGSYDECGDLSSLTLEGQTSFTCSDLGNSFEISLIVTDQAGLSSSAVGTLTIAGDNISDLNQVCNLIGDRDGDGIPDEFDPYPSDSTNNDAGAMAIFVWEDLNGNGVQDKEEPGLDNILVNLLKRDNTVIDQTSTGSEGMAYFFDVTDNRIRVEVIKPIDTRLTLRNQGEDDAFDSDIKRRTGRSRLLHIGSGEVIDDIDAGLWSPGTVESFAWDDLNGNGIQDDTEPGIPNVLIKLTEKDGTKISSAFTNAQGLASLVNVPADRRVRLQIDKPANHNRTHRNQGGDETLDSDFDHKYRSNKFKATRGRQTHTHIDAGLWSPGMVEAFVWNDENKNGIQDSTEAGVSDVRVKLFTRKNAVIATTSTNANGLATFAYVPADIRLRLQMETPSDYTLTFRNIGTDDHVDSDFSIRRGKSQTFKAQKGNELRTDIDAGLLSKSTSGASKNQVKESVEEQVTTELVEFSAMIYPNPSKGYFKVRLEDMAYDGEASLYDLNGRLIQTQSITAGETEIVMGKDGLEPGIYFVRINARHSLIIKKMIVN